MIFDRYPPENSESADFCVVGSGPVGLSIALALSRQGKRVLVLEAGGRTAKPDNTGAFALEIADPTVHAPGHLVGRQGIGGTSTAWGACCSPLDQHDLEAREHVPHSGSPVRQADLDAFYNAAAELIGVPSDFIDPALPDRQNSEVETNFLLRYAATPNTSERHAQELASDDRIRIITNTRVLAMDLGPGGDRVAQLQISSAGQKLRIKPQHVILCCGGIQSTRLLLSLQRTHPNLLGGTDGPLGRYYNGHISGAVARIKLNDPDFGRRFVARADHDGSFVRGCMRIAPEVQARAGLLNQYFALTNLPLGDPNYRNGSFSAIHLGLAARHRTSRYMTYYHPGHIETPFEFGLNAFQHLTNIVRNPFSTGRGIAEVIRTRAGRDRPQPFFSFYNPHGVYALRYHSEQMPDPDSRVTLSDRVDADGVPLPHVDMKVSETDIASILKSHDVLADWLVSSGTGTLAWIQPPENRADHVRAQASDGYHQMGLMRISDTPRTGVLDKDLRVHGISNLFSVSPGALPTGGRAHPTFAAVALGLRLADALT